MNMNFGVILMWIKSEQDWWLYLLAIGVIGIPFNLVNRFIKMDKKKDKNNRRK